MRSIQCHRPRSFNPSHWLDTSNEIPSPKDLHGTTHPCLLNSRFILSHFLETPIVNGTRTDGAYAVAFSILLLHTDAHNKNVKNKMNKETFILRTKSIEGGEQIPQEILDIMFDNIVFSKFVYAEDDMDANSQLLLKGADKQSTWFVKRGKSEPSLLGAQLTLTSDFCPKLDQLMPPENPYSYKGTLVNLNIQQIHRAFAIAQSLRVTGVRSRQPDGTSSTASLPPGKAASINANSIADSASIYASLGPPRDDTYGLKIAKAGVLERKFDLAQGGKKSSVRGWRRFGVILSGSQLIFFSDVSAFLDQVEEADHHTRTTSPTSTLQQVVPENLTRTVTSSDEVASLNGSSTSSFDQHRSEPLSPASTHVQPLLMAQSSFSGSTNSYSTISSNAPTRTTLLRPFQILSLGSSVCLYDATYNKYSHAFRLIAGDGQQFMFRAESEEEMNDWIGKINYAATFKTAGVKLRAAHHGRSGARGKARREEAEKREEVMRTELEDINAKIAQLTEKLDRDLRLRLNLIVMVPFQKSTRDRIIQYSESVGQRLKSLRIILQQLECYREILEKDLFTSQDAHHRIHYLQHGHKNLRYLGDNDLTPKSRMHRSMSASGPDGMRPDDERLSPSLMLTTPTTAGSQVFWANNGGVSSSTAQLSPTTDIYGEHYAPPSSRDPISSTSHLAVQPSPSRSTDIPHTPFSPEFYDPVELEARLRRQEGVGRRQAMTRRRTIFMDEVDENGEPVQDPAGTRRSSCPQIPPVDPGMLTEPMSLVPDLTSLEIGDRSKPPAMQVTNHGGIYSFTGRASGEHSRGSSSRRGSTNGDSPVKAVRGVWDWAAAAAKSATTVIKGTVAGARDELSSPRGSPHGSRPASPSPSTSTASQMEKMIRRRSQSNPIKPSLAIVSAAHMSALLSVPNATIGDLEGVTHTGRERSNSDSSFLREDDELSVVMVDEDVAAAEEDAERNGLIVMEDEDEDGEDIEVVDLVESEKDAGEQVRQVEEAGGGTSE
ncbi:hypothetical protein BC936DRAFT_145158 [Jimgerdemannia flammicorona]|uniref:SEC7 domain-containing protein n=1 Tax=Jimgerdemannia flammicorona TaxID=994334 RepID=A0A433DAS4_9FUNG|nr:hypothetical protein BC936DRAFT_145158 [Jimgerdemannia flammicorona]